MNRLAKMLASYGEYHRDPRNRLTHYFGVPLIVYAILIPPALRPLSIAGVSVGLDALIVGILVLVYLWLDLRFGLVLLVALGLLALAAEATAGLGSSTALIVAAAVFVVGWALQLYGHHLEGNRPALLDNLLQVFVSPIYLVAELGFALGLRAHLHAEVDSRLHAATK